eukprot:4682917-Amphidinium_carterae.1
MGASLWGYGSQSPAVRHPRHPSVARLRARVAWTALRSCSRILCGRCVHRCFCLEQAFVGHTAHTA